MELRELRGLIALSELGSITLAADRLHLSPAAIHKQLKAMEAELGVRLYEKIGRRLELTPAARVLLPYFTDSLAQFEGAMNALQEWKGLKQGAVRIGAGPTLSTYVLPALLKRYRRRYPDIDLLVETGNSRNLLDALGRGALDLALMVASESPEGSNLVVEISWDIEMVLISHLRQAPRQCKLAELRKFPFILFQQGSRLGNLVDRYFAEMDFHPRVIMRFDNAEAIKAMIRTGLGISMLPMWAVDAELKKRAFSTIRQSEKPLLSRIALVSRKLSYVPASVQAFTELTREFQCLNPRLTLHHRL
jgi:DNA-binding transcriptional LysR family regulator